MARVLGIGGIFFKSPNPQAARDWYAHVLGFEVTSWGGVIFPHLPAGKTVWSAAKPDSQKFAPSEAPWMLNLIVDDLDAVLARAEGEGVEVISRESDPFGSFASLLDPDGVKLELWQPAAGS